MQPLRRVEKGHTSEGPLTRSDAAGPQSAISGIGRRVGGWNAAAGRELDALRRASMSNIPSSVMPHAWAEPDEHRDDSGETPSGRSSLAVLAGLGALAYLVYRFVR